MSRYFHFLTLRCVATNLTANLHKSTFITLLFKGIIKVINYLTVIYGYVIMTTSKRDRGIKVKTKNMDVQMSETTIRQQKEIKAANGFSIAKAREKLLAKAVDDFHKKLCKTGDILATLNTDENE